MVGFKLIKKLLNGNVMRKFAQVKNNKVICIFDWEDNTREPVIAGLQHIDITNLNEKPYVDWIYDGINFLEPIKIPIIPKPIRVLTLLEFKRRFTGVERINILSSNDNGIKIIVDDLNSSKIISLDDVEIDKALDYLITKTIITLNRKIEILS